MASWGQHIKSPTTAIRQNARKDWRIARLLKVQAWIWSLEPILKSQVWCNPSTGQGHDDLWGLLASQPNVFGKLQASERCYLKSQGGQLLRNDTRSCPLAFTCACVCTHACMHVHTHTHTILDSVLINIWKVSRCSSSAWPLLPTPPPCIMSSFSLACKAISDCCLPVISSLISGIGQNF